MRFRTYKNTDLRVSEVGFGLWTISTGWWGQFTEGEAIALMHKAFDLGITLYDAADTYGNGLSEELIAKAFPKQRDEIVIATKVGYDFVTHGESRGRGQREIPQDFSPDAIVRATDAALKRLKTDRIDLLQLHNIRMEQVYDDAIWTTLEKSERTLGQAALQWLLADDRVASTLPNIYEEAQLIEFAKAPECPPLSSDEMEKIAELYEENFGVEREEPKFKGTMEMPAEAV